MNEIHNFVEIDVENATDMDASIGQGLASLILRYVLQFLVAQEIGGPGIFDNAFPAVLRRDDCFNYQRCPEWQTLLNSSRLEVQIVIVNYIKFLPGGRASRRPPL